MFLQELDEAKQDVERLQAELQASKSNYAKAQNTIRAARTRISQVLQRFLGGPSAVL